MPFREQVLAQARAAGLDPADPYGLMRQESRFITDAAQRRGRQRPHAGDARHGALDTAKKIGMAYSARTTCKDLDVNLRIGMAYFCAWCSTTSMASSLPLAAAAYNAGPGPPAALARRRRQLDAAAWVETIPFNWRRATT